MSKIYYHFLSSNNAIIDLERKAIKVSLVNELNDPFELMPHLGFSHDKRNKYKHIRNNLIKKYGLLCFSDTWFEPLLWGHYADKHRGIALGFCLDKLKDDIIQVKYNSERINLPNDGFVSESYCLNTMGKQKSESWRYENEYRIWIDLEKCFKINGHYFINFDTDFIIKEIILGCRHDKENYKYLVKIAKEYNANLIPTRENFSKYQMTESLKKKRKIEK